MSAPASGTPSISVVVPVYNGMGTLRELHSRLTAVLAPLGSYEILLVNDGSADESWSRILELGAGDNRLRGLNLMRNYGQHNALLAGIRSARGDVVVTLDDDLQNPPEELTKLLSGLADGIDLIYGTAVERRQGPMRNLGTRMARFALRIVIGDIASKASSFRAFRTRLRDGFAEFQAPFVSIDVLLSWSTTRIASVEVTHDPRGEGQSNYSFLKLAGHAVTMLTGFSTRPLRLASFVGVLFTLFGLAILVLVVVRFFLEGDNVPGFPFLASIIAIFSGAQLLTLGIIGEYLARIHVRSMNMPPYAIRDQIGEPG